MTGVLLQAATVVALLAVLSALLVLGATRRAAVALPVLLDLLLAAGLLRLAAHPDARTALSAAATLVVKRLATARLARRPRPAPVVSRP